MKEKAERLEEPKVMYDSKETQFSRHNNIDGHVNSDTGSMHKAWKIQSRQGLSIESEK